MSAGYPPYLTRLSPSLAALLLALRLRSRSRSRSLAPSVSASLSESSEAAEAADVALLESPGAREPDRELRCLSSLSRSRHRKMSLLLQRSRQKFTK